jgi:hypothetical protein
MNRTVFQGALWFLIVGVGAPIGCGRTSMTELAPDAVQLWQGADTSPATLLADTGTAAPSDAGSGPSLPDSAADSALADTGTTAPSDAGSGPSLPDSAADSAASDVGLPDAGRCQGTPDPCIDYMTDDIPECERQTGCTLVWAPANAPMWCEGPPWPCSRFDNETRCYQQAGCYWYPPSCFGTATRCGQLAQGDCDKTPGCTFSSASGCIGTAVPCDHLPNATCPKNPGCSLTDNGR